MLGLNAEMVALRPRMIGVVTLKFLPAPRIVFSIALKLDPNLDEVLGGNPTRFDRLPGFAARF